MVIIKTTTHLHHHNLRKVKAIHTRTDTHNPSPQKHQLRMDINNHQDSTIIEQAILATYLLEPIRASLITQEILIQLVR